MSDLMSRNHRFACCVTGIVIAVWTMFIGGCQSNEHPELRPAGGVVTFEGDPVSDATVAFHHNDAARLATGTTDADGRFQLTSYDQNDGVIPGEHRVVVTKIDMTDEAANLSMDEALTAKANKRQPKQMLPEKYSSPRTTPVVVTVGENGSQDLLIELQK